MSDIAVYRAAPATPGLVNITYLFHLTRMLVQTFFDHATLGLPWLISPLARKQILFQSKTSSKHRGRRGTRKDHKTRSYNWCWGCWGLGGRGEEDLWKNCKGSNNSIWVLSQFEFMSFATRGMMFCATLKLKEVLNKRILSASVPEATVLIWNSQSGINVRM